MLPAYLRGTTEFVKGCKKIITRQGTLHLRSALVVQVVHDIFREILTVLLVILTRSSQFKKNYKPFSYGGFTCVRAVSEQPMSRAVMIDLIVTTSTTN